jgi:hypothetical protein
MPQARQPYAPKPCAECGLLYLLPSHHGHSLSRFCSKYCYGAWYRRERQGYSPTFRYLDGQDYAEMIELRQAGVPYDEIAHRYHSKPATVWKISQRFAPDLLGSGLPRLCVICGERFQASRSDAQYCSKRCNHRSESARRAAARYRAYRRTGRRLEIERKASSSVRAALHRALERRLEFNLTGVWYQGQTGVVTSRDQGRI